MTDGENKLYIPLHFWEKRQVLPFLTSRGGKRSLVNEIQKHLPNNFNDYYEPFVGGGALFFALGHKKSYISDLNENLINTYIVVKNNLKKIIPLLKEHCKNSSEEYYYKIRKSYNEEKDNEIKNNIRLAGMYLYLNKTCFSGAYKVNNNNKFNTAYGLCTLKNIIDKGIIHECSLSLKDVDIKYQQYNKITPKKGDFVYFDPPYHDTYGKYTKDNFKEKDQIELKIFTDELTTKGVNVMLSNSNTEFIRELYKNYKVNEIMATRNLNKIFKKLVKELLITNY